MDDSELKIKLVFDPKDFKELEKQLQSTVGGMRGGNSSLNQVARTQENVAIQKVKLAREELKLEVARKKEVERQLKVEEKKTKEINKQSGFFDKMLKRMGFQGNARGEVIRGGFRELGVNIVNGVADQVSNLSGGWVSGGGAMSGAIIGASIGSIVPVVGTAIAAGVGALAGGLLLPAISKMTESFSERMKEQREYLTKLIPEGVVSNIIASKDAVVNREKEKGLLMLASGYKMNSNEAGRFVTVLQSMGVNPVALYSQALKLSKTKGGVFYGKSPSEIMDLIISGLGSKKYTKEERIKNFEWLQTIPSMENFLSSVVNMGQLSYAIRTGNLEEVVSFYEKQNIQEQNISNAVDKVIQDDITTPIEIIKKQTENLVKNVDAIIDYENQKVAVTLRTIESMKSLNAEVEMFKQTLKGVNNIQTTTSSYWEKVKGVFN